MEHPLTGEVELSVTAEFTITAEVISSELNPLDGLYHYNLQCTFSNENSTAASVQITDVIESLVIGK